MPQSLSLANLQASKSGIRVLPYAIQSSAFSSMNWYGCDRKTTGEDVGLDLKGFWKGKRRKIRGSRRTLGCSYSQQSLAYLQLGSSRVGEKGTAWTPEPSAVSKFNDDWSPGLSSSRPACMNISRDAGNATLGPFSPGTCRRLHEHTSATWFNLASDCGRTGMSTLYEVTAGNQCCMLGLLGAASNNPWHHHVSSESRLGFPTRA